MKKVEVHISGDAVDTKVINECIERFKEIKAGKLPPQLSIIAENEITDFDFSLVEYFILFKKECPQLSINITLKKNFEKGFSSDIVWKLRQVIHAYYHRIDKKSLIINLIKNSKYKPYYCNDEKLSQESAVINISVDGLANALISDKNMRDYKISDSHFRLGSKVHIKDFYYAKPFFQNSVFAYNYALLLACDIIQSKVIEEIKSNTKQIPLLRFSHITLIGYGLYSELLVCYVKEFLENHYSTATLTINTNTVTDTEECKLNKPKAANPIYHNAMIIVPIASTFTTSIKIRNMLIEEYKKQLTEYDEKVKEYQDKKNKTNITDIGKKEKFNEEISKIENKPEYINKKLTLIEPYYNVFCVVDKGFEKISGKIAKGSIFHKFGWSKIDKTKKIVKTYIQSTSKKTVDQKYCIYQETDWYKISECQICFPLKNRCENKGNCLHCSSKKCKCKDKSHCLDCSKPCVSKEKPLFVTDKTSLTPELILGQPIARAIETTNHNRKLALTDTTIGRGHIERGRNHYRYYFNNDELWNKNKDGGENSVKEWLEKWLETNPSSVDNRKREIILAPCHFSNANFVEMVNLIIFKNRATIIHYDINIENVQNFKFFYSKAIGTSKNTNIYFVDDVLTSGTTLFAANSFLQHIGRNLKFKACFFFVNRAGYYEYEDIKKVFGGKGIKNKIYSFANLHFPYIKSTKNLCPLCDEYEKLQKLYSNSYLTRIKIHFLKAQRKIEKTDIHKLKYESDNNDSESRKKTRIRRQVEAIHRMYDLFSKHTKDFKKELGKYFKDDHYGSYEGYKEWVKFLINKTNNPFDTDYLKKEDNTSINDNKNILTETEITVLKCLTRSPFYDYKDIRTRAFKWVISLLEEKVNKLNEVLNRPDKNEWRISLSSLGELKMLIRRTTLLKSNYIISYRLLHLIRKMYNNAKIFNDGNHDKEKVDNALHQFSIFFTAQMNELLHRDETCSDKLNERFKHFKDNFKKPDNKDSTLFKQLIWMLFVENAAKKRVLAEIHEKKFFERDWEGKIKRLVGSEIDIKEVVKHYEHLEKNYDLRVSNRDKMIMFLKLRLDIRKITEIPEKHDFENSEANIGKNSINSKFIDDNKAAKFIREVIETLSKFIVDKKCIPDVGCFAIVKYKKSGTSPYYLLYNKENKGNEKIPDEYLENEKFLIEFLNNGKSLFDDTESHSIMDLYRSMDKDSIRKWKEVFSDEDVADITEDFPPTQTNNRLLLLRIDRDTLKKDIPDTEYKGQAVIGFYFNVTDDKLTEPINIENLHYLLLLRGDVSKYLAKEVEGNDSFRDWVESEKKRKNMLAANHHYYHHVKDLYNCAIGDHRNINKLKFYYYQVYDAKTIMSFMESGDIAILKDDIKELYIKAEITKYCEFIFQYNVMKNTTIDIDDSLTLQFSEMIFRGVLCEYLKNINDVVRTMSNAIVQPYVRIVATPLRNHTIAFHLQNNFIMGEIERNNIATINQKGYLTSGHNGLHTNKVLLEKVSSNVEVEMSDISHGGVGVFDVKFHITRINGVENDGNNKSITS
ncbi:MAG: hypothetical protein FWD47_10150 [Treponema sp.]|nr:hypothetical protein [Treponema sp.]